MPVVLIHDGSCYQFDNNADADRFLVAHPEAVEMTEEVITVAFGDNVCHVGPHNTTVDEDGEITFSYEQDLAALGATLRTERDRRIQAVAWRIERNLSEVRQGLAPTDDLADIDGYVQALRDMPELEGWPWSGPSDPAIPWPVEP